jgi:hypothetical protein
MAWVTPKLDWATNDGIGNADFNRIEGNIDYLKGQTAYAIGQTGYFDVDFNGFATEDLRVRFYWHTKPFTYPNFVHLSWHTHFGSSNASIFESDVDSLPPSLTPSIETRIPAVVQIINGICLGTITFSSDGKVAINMPFYTGTDVPSVIQLGSTFPSSGLKGLHCGAGMFPLITE